ncbi:MAG: tetratricopeptide repeat protein [Pyrinomonadaceae bacterium]
MSNTITTLASALVQRAHETADPFYYGEAEAALRNLIVWLPTISMRRKFALRFFSVNMNSARGLKLAKELNDRSADDIQVYALMADAAIELGDYREAEEAVQWMLNLRYAGASGLARVARLRQIFGDTDGAFEMMNAAYEAISPSEVEERARNRTFVARLALTTGNVEYAEKLLQQTLRLFPEYPHALIELAGVRTVQQRHAEAADLWRRVNHLVPHPRNLYGLANALEQMGQVEEAKGAYVEFEVKARSLIRARRQC